MPSHDFDVISIHDSSDEDGPIPLRIVRSKVRAPLEPPESSEENDDLGSDDEPRAMLRNPRGWSGIRKEFGNKPESASEQVWVNQPPVPNLHARDSFRKVLGTMEDPEDIVLLYPKSLHPSFRYDENLADERQTLFDFIPCGTSSVTSDDEDGLTFEQLEITDFSVYRGIHDGKGFNGQFEDLHTVSSEQETGEFYLDAIVSHDTESRRIVGARIHDVNIGGLDDIGIHTTKGQIWVQTKHAQLEGGCWYRLGAPATEYADRFNDFLWLADLNKHVVDYICDARKRGENIRLDHFQAAFFRTLCEWHGGNEAFMAWYERTSCTDFRMHIAMHALFLKDQAWSFGQQYDTDLMCHQLWDDVAAGITTEDQQTTSKEEQTVVTPNVGLMFARAFPQWGPRRYDLLRPVAIHPKVATHREARRQNLRLPDKLSSLQSPAINTPNISLLLEQAATTNQMATLNAQRLVGKVVVVRFSRIEQQYRFAFVKEATKSSKTVRVVWLTLPNDTICGSPHEKTFYPVKNELFFSDECNCDPVPLRKIMAVHEACVLPEERYSTGTIVIQLLYREAGDAFVTPSWSELLCSCQVESKKEAASLKPQQQSQEALPKLRNMSLFSGCGLLDFGLEESGAFETVFAIDHNESSMRSHAANSKSKHCLHVIGSVNSHLERWIRGEATLFDIDCITAGCPCPGFSLLNARRFQINGQRNCSLLASTLSWIELFLPKFVLIENVPSMDHTPSKPSLANACGQAICCLVSMGYQVRKKVLNADEYGSPTTRQRLFVIAAMPNMHLPEVPLASHGDDNDLKPIMTASDVLQGLSSIQNDTVINVQDPTHIPSQRQKSRFEDKVSLRNVLKRIPQGTGQGLIKTCQDGLLSRNQRIWVSELSEEQQRPSSRTLTRINAKVPFRTIVTTISPLDCRFGGIIVHPYQHRLLSLKEIRRAQGIPDWFLLVGSLAQQIKQIGNGVAWQVAAALGRSFGDAWKASCDRAAEGSHEKPGTDETIVQLPDKLLASSKEISDPTSGKKQIQTKRKAVRAAWSIEDLSDGDSIEILVPSPVSPSPELEGDGNSEHTTSIRPKGEDVGSTKRTNTTPSSAQVNGTDRQSSSEDVYEISDHESLLIGLGGRIEYQRNRYARFRHGAPSATKKESIVVQIPSRKRTGSPTPPSALVTPKAKRNPGEHDESGSDSDIVVVETRPILKRSRLA